MMYAIFVHYGYDFEGDTIVEGTVIEVDDENDEFITWYTENNKCEYVVITQGPVIVPKIYKGHMVYSSKEIKRAPF